MTETINTIISKANYFKLVLRQYNLRVKKQLFYFRFFLFLKRDDDLPNQINRRG